MIPRKSVIVIVGISKIDKKINKYNCLDCKTMVLVDLKNWISIVEIIKYIKENILLFD